MSTHSLVLWRNRDDGRKELVLCEVGVDVPKGTNPANATAIAANGFVEAIDRLEDERRVEVFGEDAGSSEHD